MDVSNWTSQVKSNNISVESTNRMKPKLLTTLKLNIYIYIYISTKEDNLNRMVLYFRIEPNSLNIVNQDVNDKGTNYIYIYIYIFNFNYVNHFVSCILH